MVVIAMELIVPGKNGNDSCIISRKADMMVSGGEYDRNW